ncbi:MAG: carbon-nitrogen family hydrolase [Nannocystaceae bacterium]|nr:carbon-nitrogen family hydrolase [bacterium]
MRVAGIQSDIVWEDPAANFERLRSWVAAAKAAGASLVVLPEMYACGFSMDAEAIAEPPEGPSTAFLRQMAAEHDVWIAGSVPQRQAGARPKNTLIVSAPDGTLTRYAKIHPFTFAGEHEHYDAGSAFVSVTIEGVRITWFICYDLRFADEFWATAHDTDCYVVVANWPKKRREHWTTLLRARAIENQAYVVGINRVGVGGALEYSGDSRIFDPWGEAVAAAAMKETMLLADVDPQVVAEARTKFPVLEDRR